MLLQNGNSTRAGWYQHDAIDNGHSSWAGWISAVLLGMVLQLYSTRAESTHLKRLRAGRGHCTEDADHHDDLGGRVGRRCLAEPHHA